MGERIEEKCGQLHIGYNLALEFYGTGGRLPAGHVLGPVLSNAYVLQYCSEGQGCMEVDGKCFFIKCGEAIVTFPGQTRTERADDRNPWAFTWVALSGESGALFFSKMGVTVDQPVIRGWENSKAPVLLQEFVDAADCSGPRQAFYLGMKIFEFMEESLRLREEQERRDRGKESGGQRKVYVDRAVYYLNMHYPRQDVSIQGLAEHMGLNRSYLYEIFKAEMGLSPQEYLTRLRIAKACEYLRLPQATVTSVAFAVGYEPSVFTKAFKKIMGVNPSEFNLSSLK